jgi:hypothetical protein
VALIDASEILLDPDFADQATLIKRSVTVNANGEAVISEIAQPITAVIQGLNNADLLKMPEGARLSDAITVHYRGELQAEAPGGYSDIIVWRGKRYEVGPVTSNFMNHGAGYTRAICVGEAVSA